MSLQSQTAKAAKRPKIDLQELQRKQLDGEDLDTQKGNTAEGADYDLPTHEADRVHVRVTQRVNDATKKEYVDETRVIKLVPAQYDRMVANNYFDTQTYDKVEVLHDPRRAAGAKAEAPATGNKPWEPVEGLPTLQDAQVRYQQLTGRKAPAVEYDILIEFIRAAEADSDEQTTEPEASGEGDTPTRKALRSTADAQARYKELFGVDAPADKSFTELKTLIEAEEALRSKQE
ncbi:hypothetical protein LJ737_04290 [Hymenobacter sp. 15J16-1T3B]|uniref:hypothetical protein n=1 Tax=Hymenobacter sp. 15J16-1T3B TaxID=2886941 RepID=UPI001D1214DE|nr:hypothetical protein [Hymenobacter sp. 15J16-1T3B]MCC3156442.1 hypothetical protein [Hymenobacter sp. 15J16-1T3B]